MEVGGFKSLRQVTSNNSEELSVPFSVQITSEEFRQGYHGADYPISKKVIQINA